MNKRSKTVLGICVGITVLVFFLTVAFFLVQRNSSKVESANTVQMRGAPAVAYEKKKDLSELIDPQKTQEIEQKIRQLELQLDQLKAGENSVSKKIPSVAGSRETRIAADIARLESEMQFRELAHDSLMAIDQHLESMQLGNIAFNAPTSINLNESTVIKLLLAVETPIEELKQLVEEKGEKVGARIKVSSRMEARLSGSNFEIVTMTPEIQAVSLNEPTEWMWEIEPKKAGNHRLHLTLSVVFTFDGMATSKTMSTYDKFIDVDVTWTQLIWNFLDRFWEWLTAVTIAPVAGWLWVRFGSKNPRKSKPQTEIEDEAA
jgi:hypothetical protein